MTLFFCRARPQTMSRSARSRRWAGMPSTRTCCSSMNLRVPASDVVGEVGRGFYQLLDGLNPERILIAGEIGRHRPAGGLERATQLCQGAAMSSAGRSGMNQSIQHPLAHSWMDLEASWLATMRAAALYDAGRSCGAEANMAKYLAAEAGFKRVRAGRPHTRRHGIRAGVSRRAAVPRSADWAAGAGQPATDQLLTLRSAYSDCRGPTEPGLELPKPINCNENDTREFAHEPCAYRNQRRRAHGDPQPAGKAQRTERGDDGRGPRRLCHRTGGGRARYGPARRGAGLLRRAFSSATSGVDHATGGDHRGDVRHGAPLSDADGRGRPRPRRCRRLRVGPALRFRRCLDAGRH